MYYVITAITVFAVCATALIITRMVCDAFGPNMKEVTVPEETTPIQDGDGEKVASFDDVIAEIYDRLEEDD